MFQLKNREKSIVLLSTIVAIAAVVTSFLIGGLSVGGLAPRVFILPIGAVLGVWWIAKFSNDIQKSSVIGIVIAGSVLIFWLSITYYLGGSTLKYIAHKMLSTHVLSILFFLTLIPVATTRQTRNLLIFSICGTILVSGSLAVLQWLNVGWAWNIAAYTNSRFVQLWSSTVPGLAMHSVALGYQVLLVFPFLVRHFIFKAPQSNTRSSKFGYAVFLIPLMILVIQSRSLAAACVLICVAFFLIKNRMAEKSAPINYSKFATLFSCVLLTTVLISTESGNRFIQKNLNPAWMNTTISYKAVGTQREGLDSGSLRVQAANALLLSIKKPQDAIFGPSVDKYKSYLSEDNKNLYPHNLFFNSILVGGVPALLMVLYLLWRHWKILIYNSKENFEELIVLPIGYLALLANSMLHNDSILFGSVYPWILVSISVGLSSSKSELQSSQPC